MLVARERSAYYPARVRVPDYKQRKQKDTVPQKHLQIKAKAIVLLVLVFMVMVLLIAQYCRFVALKLEIDQVEGQIARLQEEKSRLEVEVKKLSSLERIELIALEELGLQYPAEEQWLVITSR